MAGQASDEAVADVLEEIRDRVTPAATEREALETAVERLLERTRTAVADLPVHGEVVHLGSTARGTWLPGTRDIDIFVRFSTELSREELEKYGLQVGHSVLPDGRATFAEHPYVTGSFDGFDVDLVPCFAVSDAGAIRSAVDRTPFHNAYLEDRLHETDRVAVRVFKQFCTAAGVYGSDLRTRGLSGYLVELLVLEYGGAAATLRAVANWSPPVVLDPVDHGDREFEDPLVVVDPTDPDRNVAAVVSEESVARLQHHARAFLADPQVEAFEPVSPDQITPESVRDHVDRRGTHPVAVRTELPPLVDDQLYPQLRRSVRGIRRGLRDHGFEVLRTAAVATPLVTPDPNERTAVLLFELASGDRPAIERHVGPPVHVREHAESFLETYTGDSHSQRYGPFIEGDRYVVERERDVRTARAFFETEMASVALGTDVRAALESGYDVLEGAEIAELATEFGHALAHYFDPRP